MAFFAQERRLVRVKKTRQPEETHGNLGSFNFTLYLILFVGIDADTQRAYVSLYVKMKRGTMSKEERLKLETMEQMFSFDDIWSSRLIGQAQLAKEREKVTSCPSIAQLPILISLRPTRRLHQGAWSAPTPRRRIPTFLASCGHRKRKATTQRALIWKN